MAFTGCGGGMGGAAHSAVFGLPPNPAPVVNLMSPTTAAAGAGNTTVTLNMSGALRTSLVYAGLTALATTYVSSTQLTAVVPASMLTAATTLSITVVNPAPGGGTSFPRSLVVAAAGVPTLATPNCFNVANLDNNYWDHAGGVLEVDFPNVGTTDLIINTGGTNFTAAAVVYLNGTTALATTYVSATFLHFVMPVSYFTADITYTMTVVVPGVGTSNAKTIHTFNFYA